MGCRRDDGSNPVVGYGSCSHCPRHHVDCTHLPNESSIAKEVKHERRSRFADCRWSGGRDYRHHHHCSDLPVGAEGQSHRARHRSRLQHHLGSSVQVMNWAGWQGWFSEQSEPPITRWYNRAAEPWVKTDSGTPPPRVLTSGSDLNRTAEGPWRPLIDAGQLDYGPPSQTGGTAEWSDKPLRTVQAIKQSANYGSISSISNFSWRHWAFPAPLLPRTPTVGRLPGPIPDPHRPMWNNLPPALYNMRVPNPAPTQLNELRTFTSNAYSMAGPTFNAPASLSTGYRQGEVLL